MSIVVNGVTIPTSGDYIKVGSTLIDKVDVVKNGVRTTVWEKIKTQQITDIMTSYVFTKSFLANGSSLQPVSWTIGTFPKSGKLKGNIVFTLTKPSYKDHCHYQYGNFTINRTNLLNNIHIWIDHFLEYEDDPTRISRSFSFYINDISVTTGDIIMTGQHSATTSWTLKVDLSQLTITY